MPDKQSLTEIIVGLRGDMTQLGQQVENLITAYGRVMLDNHDLKERVRVLELEAQDQDKYVDHLEAELHKLDPHWQES